ncbi:DMT family transporter [Pseudofulvimonas gallinarii]|jgi:drug/metabolite transporter (DMT)-like permease|uniref:Drug/metabolite transporter (DMT)-like permease n=1 Tax=Pseudofulvimonas gallinarii TaxID=634155 RepID=A0A4R3LPH7_9GAMM|nr:DMT family transporter [Pseudofulvimonas gallinarii]TCT01419.1 drug/metabolite transporter (DMT)-like permease [Pseudofulvimonas gallinarii]THD12593.1 EamA family transporter [Pseudofulvimonas gallinarii]
MSSNPAAIESPLPPATRTAEWRNSLDLLVLGAIWGGSFMLQRVAAPEFGALALVELRVLFGTLVLLPFLVAAWPRLKPYRWRLALIGLLNSAVPFVLFAWAAGRAPAAIGAITNSMAALFAVLVAALMFRERIGARRGIGLLAGFAGVIVLVGGRSVGLDTVWAGIAGTLAALCYGVAGNLVKRWLTGLPSTATAAATLAWTTLLLAPWAIASWPQARPGTNAWVCAIILGLVATGAAYAMYFRMIERMGPSRAATVTYLVPLSGVAWAWALLGEAVTPTMVFAGALILGGVALNQARPAVASRSGQSA